MSLTPAGNGFAILACAGGLIILACVAYAFRRSRRTGRELGPWSVLLAFLSFATGLFLIAYGICAIGSGVSTVMARGRLAFFELFVSFATAAILVLPLVLLQLPLTAVIAFIAASALLLVELGEVIFFPSIIAFLTLPLVLCIEFIALRVTWGTGRTRLRDEAQDEQYAHRHEAHGDDTVKQFPGPSGVRSRRIEPYPAESSVPAFALLQQQNAASKFGAIEAGPGASAAGATTLVSVSAAAVGVTIAESLLLAVLGAGCNDAYLHAMMGVFAITHGLLCIAVMAPATTFG
jgi:hypothetical protein